MSDSVPIYVAMVPLLMGVVALVQMFAKMPVPVNTLCVCDQHQCSEIGQNADKSTVYECHACSSNILSLNYIFQWISFGLLVATCLIVLFKDSTAKLVGCIAPVMALLLSCISAILFTVKTNDKDTVVCTRRSDSTLRSISASHREVAVVGLNTAAVFFAGTSAILLLACVKQ